MINITLDYPPSANRYWRSDRGRVHRSDEAVAYCDYVALICRTAGMEPMGGEIAIGLRFYRPIKRGDLDNRIKIMLDAMQGCAYLNDSQVTEIHAFRHDDKQRPRVEICVKLAKGEGEESK